jgi:hypothetical protein
MGNFSIGRHTHVPGISLLSISLHIWFLRACSDMFNLRMLIQAPIFHALTQRKHKNQMLLMTVKLTQPIPTVFSSLSIVHFYMLCGVCPSLVSSCSISSNFFPESGRAETARAAPSMLDVEPRLWDGGRRP